MKPFYFSISLLLLLTLMQCKLKNSLDKATDTVADAATQTTAVLDKAISGMTAESANWREVLQTALNELPAEVQSTIRVEMTDLMNRAVAATGSELRCNGDFIRNRLIQSLQNIKAKLLGNAPSPLEPQLCSVVPLTVDMELDATRRNKLEFYGYDFDKAAIQVLLDNNGNLTDVSSFLDQPTHYHMTLNLAGNGVPLNSASKRLILKWNNRDISVVGVLQPSTPICQEKTITVTPAPQEISFMPPHTGGDREFQGHGPDILCHVKLIHENNRLDAEVFMSAHETRNDWTQASGRKRFTVFQADPGWQITEIIGSMEDSYSYRDSDNRQDKFAGGGPVLHYLFMGDGEGDDVGTHTGVSVTLNPIRLVLKQNANCVTKKAMEDAIRIRTLYRTTVDMRSTERLHRLVTPSNTP